MRFISRTVGPIAPIAASVQAQVSSPSGSKSLSIAQTVIVILTLGVQVGSVGFILARTSQAAHTSGCHGNSFCSRIYTRLVRELIGRVLRPVLAKSYEPRSSVMYLKYTWLPEGAWLATWGLALEASNILVPIFRSR